MTSPLIDLNFDSKKGILYAIWKTETEKAKWPEMQEAMLEYADRHVRTDADYLLVDERELKYIWVPENQIWVDENIIPKVLKTSTKKTAIVQSEHIFAAIAVEQMMSEKNASNLNNRFFNTAEDAENWLLQ